MVTNVMFEVSESFEAVDFSKVKKHLRLDCACDDEDELIESYIGTAIVVCENYIGAHIAQKEMIIVLNELQPKIVFEANPIISIKSVKGYIDDVLKDIDPESYKLNTVNQKVYSLDFKDFSDLPKFDKRADAVLISIEVGYLSGKVPKPIQQAILLKVADMYERRDDRGEMVTLTSQQLLRPYKIF